MLLLWSYLAAEIAVPLLLFASLLWERNWPEDYGCLAALTAMVKRTLEIIWLALEKNEFICCGERSLDLFCSQAACKYIIFVCHL